MKTIEIENIAVNIGCILKLSLQLKFRKQFFRGRKIFDELTLVQAHSRDAVMRPDEPQGTNVPISKTQETT